MLGDELHEEDGRKRVRGLQQRYVSPFTLHNLTDMNKNKESGNPDITGPVAAPLLSLGQWDAFQCEAQIARTALLISTTRGNNHVEMNRQLMLH